MPANLLTYPEDFLDAVWATPSCTITGSVALAPDGTWTADKVSFESTFLAFAFLRQVVVGSRMNANRAYNWNIFAKSIVGSVMYLRVTNENDLDPSPINNIPIPSGEMFGNGWFRLSMTHVFSTNAQSSMNQAVLLGANSGDQFYLWGAKLEENAEASPYTAVSSWNSDTDGPKKFFDNVPSYPLREMENWRVLVAEMESGVEQRTSRWNYPRREWDLVWRAAHGSADTTPIRDFLNGVKGAGTSFFWKEPNLTDRNRIFMGTGTGIRANWVLPLWSPSSFLIRVAGQVLVQSVHYLVWSCYGQNSLHIIDIRSPNPAAGALVECDYVQGYYVPLVRLAGNFQHALTLGFDRGEISITFRETKEEMPQV